MSVGIKMASNLSRLNSDDNQSVNNGWSVFLNRKKKLYVIRIHLEYYSSRILFVFEIMFYNYYLCRNKKKNVTSLLLVVYRMGFTLCAILGDGTHTVFSPLFPCIFIQLYVNGYVRDLLLV